MAMYKANDPASPTPAADASGVVSFFADFGLVACGTDGQVRWKTDRPGAPIGYATPMMFRPSADRADIITIGSTRLDAYDLATGKPRWWRAIGTGGSMGVALAQDDTVWLSTLASNEPGLPQWATSLAQYDKDKDSRISVAELAEDKELGAHFGWIDTSDDTVITEAEWNVARTLGMGAWGAVAVKPGGIITALDAATGALLKEGRATGKVYVTSQEGKMSVLKAGPQWEVLAVNDLGEEINATPALANGRLYVRTREAVYCFGR